MDQGGNGEACEKWPDSGYILETVLLAFAERLLNNGKKEESKMTLRSK